MGKVDRLRNWCEPFAALFWAVGIVLANTWPCTPAQHHSTAMHTQSMSLYGHSWINSLQRRAGPIPFSYLGVLFIYGLSIWNVLLKSRNLQDREVKLVFLHFYSTVSTHWNFTHISWDYPFKFVSLFIFKTPPSR